MSIYPRHVHDFVVNLRDSNLSRTKRQSKRLFICRDPFVGATVPLTVQPSILQESGAKIQRISETAKKIGELFGEFKNNAYLCNVKHQVWLRR